MEAERAPANHPKTYRAPPLSPSSENPGIYLLLPSLDGHWGLTLQGLKHVCLGTGRSKDEAWSKGSLATAVAQPSQLQ